MEPLSGLTVIAFESRRASELRRLLEKRGATVVAAPALREIPLDDNPAAFRFVEELEAGRIDVLVLLTGVGTRALFEAVEPRCPRARLVELLQGIPLVVRGPKPAAVLRELGLSPNVRASEPNTWREVLSAIDRELPVAGRRVAVQEYGRTNTDLIAALRRRGAEPISVPVYRWGLPEDLGPLRGAIERILTGETHVVVFTTAVQLDHLCQVAADAAAAVVGRLRDRNVVASIGPSASQALRARGIEPDIEPVRPKLGPLVAALAEHAADHASRKRGRED